MHHLDTIYLNNLRAVDRAYSVAVREGLPVTEYDAWRIGYNAIPAVDVRAEHERKLKAQKAVQKRIASERKVIRHAVKALLAQGYAITVYNGEEVAIRRSTSVNAIMDEVQACDEEWLYVFAQVDGEQKRIGSLYLVYGNSGPEVIADYSVSLEHVMEGVNAYCDKLEEQGF